MSKPALRSASTKDLVYNDIVIIDATFSPAVPVDQTFYSKSAFEDGRKSFASEASSGPSGRTSNAECGQTFTPSSSAMRFLTIVRPAEDEEAAEGPRVGALMSAAPAAAAAPAARQPSLFARLFGKV